MAFVQEKCRLVINFISDADDQEMLQQQENILLEVWRTITLQVKTGLLLFIFILKEMVLSVFGYIDLIFISIFANFGIFLIKIVGCWRDRNYVNPQRMFLVRTMETQAGRARVAIRRVAAMFAFLLMIPFVHQSIMNMAENTLETIQDNIMSSFGHMWHSSKIPKAIEWEDGMEKTIYTDDTVSTIPFTPFSSSQEREDKEQDMPSSQGSSSQCMASQWPYWLSMFHPNAVLCKACHSFISNGGCDQSKDDLADVALATLGSRVLTGLTSPTLDDGEEDKGLLSMLFKQPVIKPRAPSPLIALMPWQHPGECWPMAGQHGSIGVELRQPVSVKAISVDYLGQYQSSNMASAPGDFEVWGLIKFDDNRSWKYPWDSLASVVDNDVLYLGRYMYDITKSLSVQTFELKSPTTPIKAVIFRFLSNWGNNDYTCIYRVRVHGA